MNIININEPTQGLIVHKYATYKQKMLARNQLIMFSGRFCQKKKKKT